MLDTKYTVVTIAITACIVIIYLFGFVIIDVAVIVYCILADQFSGCTLSHSWSDIKPHVRPYFYFR